MPLAKLTELPKVHEVVSYWSDERIKQLYHILDEASAIKQAGPVPYPQEVEAMRKVAYPEDTQQAGMAATQDMHVSQSGATSSHVPLRYDLIPRSLFDRAAERYTLGAKIHGMRGYQKGFADRDFILNRINHINEHWNMLWHPDYRRADSPESEEGIDLESIRSNLGAILWGIGFICEVAEHDKGRQILIDLRAEGRVKTHTD